MPVRIYDISKQLGLENKEVLSKAKELGIAAAKVPSSSLDKITAEYLIHELTGGRGVATATAPAPPAEPEKIILVTAPPPKPEPEPVAEAATPAESAVAPEEQSAPAHDASTTNGDSPQIAAPSEPVTPPPPPAPTGPQVGDKVGFIQLPQKAAPKPAERPRNSGSRPERSAQWGSA